MKGNPPVTRFLEDGGDSAGLGGTISVGDGPPCTAAEDSYLVIGPRIHFAVIIVSAPFIT